MRDGEWTTAEALQGALGIGRSTFYRRVQTGEIEHAEIGGSKLYRPAVRVVEPSQSGPVPRDERGQSGTIRDVPRDESGQRDSDRAALLALVSKYETRIDALLVDHQAATREAREARERAAALAVELEAERGRAAAALEAERGRAALAKLEAEHARQLAAVEAARIEAEHAQREARAVEALKLEAERAREAAARTVEAHAVEVERLRAAAAQLEHAQLEERRRREAAEARAASVEALASLPWWRFGAKRRARALLSAALVALVACGSDGAAGPAKCASFFKVTETTGASVMLGQCPSGQGECATGEPCLCKSDTACGPGFACSRGVGCYCTCHAEGEEPEISCADPACDNVE